MKKNQTQKLVIAGIAALTIGLFSACGGGNESGKGAAKGIATNGIMGNVPALVAQFDSDLETLALKMKEEQSDEKRAKLVEEYDELCSTIETTMKEAVAAVNGKEVPAEVQEGVPFELDGNLVLEMKATSRVEPTIHALGSGKVTDPSAVGNIGFVAYDTDNNVIAVTPRGSRVDAKGDVRFTVKTISEQAASWAKLGKIVLMDKESDAYKQAKAQVEGE